jgi:hypothetical protein
MLAYIYYLAELQMNPQLQAILQDLYAKVKKLENEIAELRKAQEK